MTQEKKENRGGKREGSGRKKGRVIKKNATYKLPKWIIYFIRRRSSKEGISQADIIENALKSRYDFIKPSKKPKENR